jgi:hypothetical protein
VLGPTILESIIKSREFNITVLSRTSSSTKPPAGVKSMKIDFDSFDVLTKALEGQEVIIANIGHAGIPFQIKLIDAAIAAKVKLFIPSEFGSDTTNGKARALPVFRGKVEVQEYLIQKASEGSISYALLFTGPFLDLFLAAGIFCDLKGYQADLYDGGDGLFSTTRVETVGKALVGILRNYPDMRNRAIFVQDAMISQRMIVDIAEEVTGHDFGRKIVSTAELESEAYEEMKKESPDPKSFLKFIKRAVWGSGYGGRFERSDNDALGVHELTRAEITASIEMVIR